MSIEKLNNKLDNENDELGNDESEEEQEEQEEQMEEVEIYTLEDEDGNESEFTLIKRINIGEQSYVAFEPFNEVDVEEEEDSFVILKVIEEDGEEIFVTIEDDAEFDQAADVFEDILMKEMEEMEEDDESEDEDGE